MIVEIDKENSIACRLTPWDSKTFGFETAEITSFKCNDLNLGIKLMRELDVFVAQHSIKFIYTRIKSENRIEKEILIKYGFYIAESSLEIFKNNLAKYQFKLPTVSILPFSKEDDTIVNDIKLIARDSFDYSRFHDDVNIEEEKARLRYFNWIDDLLSQGNEAYYIEYKGEIIGFHFQRIKGDHADLILTGCKKGKSELSVPLWHSVFLNLCSRGIKECSTLISSSNAPIINLYIFFQFKVRSSLLGLHKFCNEHDNSI